MEQIKKIEAILRYFETGVKPDHLELSEILKQIDKLNEDKYLAHYKNFLEFKQPLLMRTSIHEGGDKPELKY